MTTTIEKAEPQFLQAPAACGNELEQVEWAGTAAVRVADELHLGVRFDNAELMQVFTESLGDRVDTEIENPRPFFSVRLGTPGKRKKAPLHYLYLGAKPVLGTRDVARLLQGVVNHVSAYVSTDLDGYVVDAVPVHSPRGLMLVPQEILAMTQVIDRVLLPAGFRFADIPRARLEPATGAVVVPEPAVSTVVDTEAVSALGPTGTEPTLAPGRYPLVSWLLSVSADAVGPLRPAAALFYAARLLEPPYPSGAQTALRDAQALVDSTTMTGVTWSTPEELVAQVLEAGQA